MRGRRPEPKKSGGKGRLVMLLLLLMFLAAGGLAAAALFLPEEYLPEGLHEQIRELKRSIGLEAGIADEDSSARPTEEPVASPVPADSADEPADIFGDIDTPTSARDATIGIEFDEPGLPDVVIPDSGGAAAPAPPPAADIEM